MSYTRFVTITEQRTGSTFLQLLLASHTDVLSFGELFNPRPAIRLKSSKLVEALKAEDDPIEYLEGCVYKEYPANIKAVGFRLFYTHAKQGKWSAVWDYLRTSGVHVIHLKRRNLLDRYLSLQLAYKSKKWIAFQGDGDGAYSAPITINIRDCIKDFHEMEWYQNQINHFFKDNPNIEVFYEDLNAEPSRECRAIQEFLGLEVQSLSANSVKQQTKSRAEVIANYDQLKEQLRLGVSKGWARQEWLEFLAEPIAE